MKAKWLKTGFWAASLALNFAFAAPYIYNKFLVKHKEPEKEIKLKTKTNTQSSEGTEGAAFQQ